MTILNNPGDAAAPPDMTIAAAALLGAARRGDDISALPQPLRPTTLPRAEAVQHATLAALGLARGGWKLGRHGPHVFSAPMPAAHIGADHAITLPANTRIELEIALRLRAGLAPDAALDPAECDLVVLFEFVRSRFAVPAEVTALERIADCVANHSFVAVSAPGAWVAGILEDLPEVSLVLDGRPIARHAGPHPAAPLAELLSAFANRRASEGLTLQQGEIITPGSLTGILPVPAEGGVFTGTIGALPRLHCVVRPA